MAGLVEKIEINCDMGEGFGRWKMVCAAMLPPKLNADKNRDQTTSS
jgi:hypothetical protein